MRQSRSIEVRQQAQNIALDAEVVRNDVVRRNAAAQYAGLAAEGRSLAPLVGHVRRDELRQVHAGNTGKLPRVLDGGGLRDIAGHDASRLRAFLANDSRQLAGIDIGDCDRLALPQEIAQRALITPAAGHHRQVADDEPGRVSPGRLHVLGRRAGVADMRIGESDDLPAVGRIGKDLLVTGHCGIENDFADSLAVGTNGDAMENGAILQSQYSRRTQMQTSVRNSTGNPNPDRPVISVYRWRA
jgi:hypothetical protein